MAENPTWLCVVAAALQRADGCWLMQRRPAHKQHGGLWEFPGGKVDPGETRENALIRELREELGIVCEAAALRPACFAQTSAGDGRPATVILLYTLRVWNGTARALEAGGAAGWFTPAGMAMLDRPPLDIALCATLFGADGRGAGGPGGAGG